MFIATFNNVSVFYHPCAVVRAFRRLMCYATFNIQSFTTLLHKARGFKGLMVYATFNIVTVIYRTCAIGRGFRRLMFFATFNIVLVIYRTCAIGRGVQDAHVYCHFFNNVSVLYHTCFVVRAFRRLISYATNNIQSFTTPLL